MVKSRKLKLRSQGHMREIFLRKSSFYGRYFEHHDWSKTSLRYLGRYSKEVFTLNEISCIWPSMFWKNRWKRKLKSFLEAEVENFSSGYDNLRKKSKKSVMRKEVKKSWFFWRISTFWRKLFQYFNTYFKDNIASYFLPCKKSSE